MNHCDQLPGEHPPPTSALPPDLQPGPEFHFVLAAMVYVFFCWLFALGFAALGRKDMATVMMVLLGGTAMVWLGFWFFPCASRHLGSPVLGFFVGLPLFVLMAAAIVLFLGSTCYGIVVATS